MPSQGAPLWPAGHLPLKGGDRLSPLVSPITKVVRNAPPQKLPISPLEGEMSGRTEGGLVERQRIAFDYGAQP
ncbi:MAG: lytic murein transglycosylase [Mesorhizobium sp.]|nr:MAG: lytic murein transglycosylase [Mesorhizobium sp.]TJV00788.1 MAG: lytic murein transglycosylase [Mesorhizobium sp.]TJV15664.1 MAG: lytic murein transglycosylase [Mesorhizobium sp.]